MAKLEAIEVKKVVFPPHGIAQPIPGVNSKHLTPGFNVTSISLLLGSSILLVENQGRRYFVPLGAVMSCEVGDESRLVEWGDGKEEDDVPEEEAPTEGEVKPRNKGGRPRKNPTT